MYASELFIEEKAKIIKRVTTKNYEVEDYKNPPSKSIKKEKGKEMYRSKKIKGKDGKWHVIRFAIMKEPGPRGGRTQATSKWDEKD